MPEINAFFNGSAAVCLILGYYFIRRDKPDIHRNFMVAALVASGLFLVGYLTRVQLEGTHYFPGEGWIKTVYLSILFSHMVLATVVVPLVLRVAYLAVKGRFEKHKQWARWTYPIWLYVSITGIVVYFMLYQLYA